MGLDISWQNSLVASAWWKMNWNTFLPWGGLWKTCAFPSLGHFFSRKKEGRKVKLLSSHFYTPVLKKLLISSIHVQLGAGYLVPWGLKITNANKNLPAGLNHPGSPAVPSAQCLEMDWQSWDHTMEGGPQDPYSPSQPLPYFFLKANKALLRSERQQTNFPQEEGFFPR